MTGLSTIGPHGDHYRLAYRDEGWCVMTGGLERVWRSLRDLRATDPEAFIYDARTGMVWDTDTRSWVSPTSGQRDAQQVIQPKETR